MVKAPRREMFHDFYTYHDTNDIDETDHATHGHNEATKRRACWPAPAQSARLLSQKPTFQQPKLKKWYSFFQD